MRIGLIAADGRGAFPNLALMRLSTWHKRQGDVVDWWNGFERYDRVYMSKVFTFTPDFDTAINAEEIITGGTGYKDLATCRQRLKPVRQTIRSIRNGNLLSVF